jgi:PEP-CTERM motif
MNIVSFTKAFVSCSTAIVALAIAPIAAAAPFFFSTGPVTDSMAAASRPGTGGVLEIEAADDFVLTGTTRIDSATFTGLLADADPADINQILVEIYRVFPLDSDTSRTPNVPTRTNSPSDVAFADRDSAAGELTFTTVDLGANFTASNSVLNGINPKPNQTTLGEGPVTGTETELDVTFTTPLLLPAGHYFFVPQVGITGPGQFYWLSASRNPIQPPGTPFSPDLQSWIRNENLAPDWLRIGTDIVGGTTPTTFNQAFSLAGVVPEPGSLMLLGVALAAFAATRRRAR